jgi:K+ transporter
LAEERIKISDLEKGQMYIAQINWFCGSHALASVMLFRESATWKLPYGLSINITLLYNTTAHGFVPGDAKDKTAGSVAFMYFFYLYG